jgi:glutathione S-transferase
MFGIQNNQEIVKDDIKYKLHYFDVNGRGAAIRALLSYLKLDWSEVKYNNKQWEESKKTFDFQQLPALEEIKDSSSHVYVQTIAILLYLSRKHNLLGRDPEEEFIITNYICLDDDFRSKIKNVFYPSSQEDYDKQVINLDNLLEKTFPLFLNVIEKRLLENKKENENSPYAVGESFSLADIIITVTISFIFLHPLRKDLLEPLLRKLAPTLSELVDSFRKKELKHFFDNYFILDKAY